MQGSSATGSINPRLSRSDSSDSLSDAIENDSDITANPRDLLAEQIRTLRNSGEQGKADAEKLMLAYRETRDRVLDKVGDRKNSKEGLAEQAIGGAASAVQSAPGGGILGIFLKIGRAIAGFFRKRSDAIDAKAIGGVISATDNRETAGLIAATLVTQLSDKILDPNLEATLQSKMGVSIDTAHLKPDQRAIGDFAEDLADLAVAAMKDRNLSETISKQTDEEELGLSPKEANRNGRIAAIIAKNTLDAFNAKNPRGEAAEAAPENTLSQGHEEAVAEIAADSSAIPTKSPEVRSREIKPLVDPATLSQGRGAAAAA